MKKTVVKQDKWESKSGKWLILIFIFAAIILLASGVVYLKNEEVVSSKQALKQLQNSSVLKARQIEAWRRERLSDAREIAQSPLLQDAVNNWLNHHGKKELKSEIQQRLYIFIQNNPDSENILITDTNGLTLLTGKTNAPDFTTASTGKLVREVIKTNHEIFSDLYKNSRNGAIYADIACPIYNDRHEIDAVILFRLHTEVSLFPILNDLLYDSTTEESFLFEKAGDSVLYLTNLRNRPNAALSLSFPLTNNENPAVRAVNEGPGFYEGKGYHGQKVLEYIQPIKGSPWFLASKIDRDELFKPVYQRAKTISIILILLFLSLSTVVFLIINYRRKHFYRQLLEEERKEAALKSHFEYVVKYANDIILLEDENLNIIEANQRAQQIYHYSLEELLNMKITDLVAPDLKKQVETRLKNITEKDGAIIESIHQRKDGSLFDVEISARIINVNGRDFLHQVIRDITERKQAEIALAESEERFRTTLYSTGDAIITTDINGKIQYMNPVAEELTGWKEAEAGGKPIREVFSIFNEDTREEVGNPVDKVLEKGMIVLLSNHTLLKSKNGNEIPIGDSGAPIRNAKGEIAGVVLVFRDQIKERLAKRTIEESELHFHSLANFSPVGIFRTRTDGYTTYVNPKWCQLSGLSAEKALGDGWVSAVHPEDREKLAGEWKLASQSDSVSVSEYRFLQPDGTVVYVLGQVVPEINSENQITGYIGTITDITERKKSEKELLLFRTLMDGSNDALEILDPETGRFLDMNTRASQDLGYSREEMLELSVFDIDPRVDKPAFEQIKEELLKSDNGIWEGIHLRKDGSSFPVEVNIKIVELDQKYMVAVARDISTRKQAEEELRSSEEKFRSVYENSVIGIYRTTLEGKVVMCNKKLLQMLGYDSLEELSDRNLEIEGYEPDYPRMHFKTVIEQNGFVEDLESFWIRKDGTTICVSEFARLVRGENNNPLYYDGMVLDITERKNAEEKFELAHRQLENLHNNLNDAIFSFDTIQNKMLVVSAAHETVFGCPPSEFYQNPQLWNELVFPEDKPIVNAGYPFLFAGKDIQHEIRITRPDGQMRWIQAKMVPTLDVHGKLVRVDGIVSDITGRKRAEKELRLLQRAVERNPASIVITNTEGIIEYVNPQFTAITGYTPLEVLGKKPNILKSGNQSPEIYRNLWETISTGNIWSGEILNKRENGELYWENMLISPVEDNSGKITHYVGVKEDITEKRKMIQDLIIAKEHAEESDRLKTAFLTNISHEIRTPMNGILGFAELLKIPGLSGDQQQEYISIIKKSSDRMLNIINDIVDISKIESGLMNVEIKESNINEQTEYIYSFFNPRTERKGIKLICKNGLSGKDAIITTDKEKVYAILTNLVKNAIKFTDNGTIEFGYTLKQASLTTGQEELEFFVKDTGIGIPKDRQLAIFDRFVQADIADTKAYQGAGLGLSISKAYVEMLGGKIWVESEVGKGSVFYFSIPYYVKPEEKKVNHTNGSEVATNKIKKLKILVVDDDFVSEMLLSIALKEHNNNEVIKAYSGDEAITVCRNNPDIDLVMMDIKMPVMDGYQTTSEIRKFNKEIIIIAQTAFSLAGDRDKALAAGCDDYISKPIQKDVLRRLIEKYFKS
ncbi:MAG: PAS domain S-box protein [Lentimicrobiaceae bacterium]|jgi:hypothetical protein